jgi:adenylylsulfate kinase
VEAGFAVWITGLPASGKSTIASALREELASFGVNVAVLESDTLRKVFTPQPRYDEEEREVFYGSMAHVGKLLTEHGVSVIFDATANRRTYRDRARGGIAKFLEVFVDCPLSVCVTRDPKGIYRKGREGSANWVPGLQADYEPPLAPDVVVRSNEEEPAQAARRIINKLVEAGYVKERRRHGGAQRNR